MTYRYINFKNYNINIKKDIKSKAFGEDIWIQFQFN